MNYDLQPFKTGLEQLHIELSELQIEQFLDYYELLIEWNQVMNLTAIIEFQDVIEKHFLDSLSLVKIMDLRRPLKVIDVGTGAGFPGIPLKIAFPQLNITLLDSLNKRVGFLNQAIERLKLDFDYNIQNSVNILKNNAITAIHGRAEEIAKSLKYREQYDLCVSRAVANLSTLSEYCLPFVKVGGHFISYKSGKIQEEAAQAEKAIKILGGKSTDITAFSLSQNGPERSFVKISKIKTTPAKYPRKAGTPSKQPL